MKNINPVTPMTVDILIQQGNQKTNRI